MNIGEAVCELLGGRRVRRIGWNGKGMWLILIASGHRNGKTELEVQDTFGNSFGVVEVVPFVAMKTTDNKIVPWLCSQTDLLAEDWETVPNNE